MSNERDDSITGDKTEPTEIPTAAMEYQLFGDGDDSGTAADTPTADVTAREGSGDLTPDIQKFRRPTPDEIADAVDRVKTQTLDVSELGFETEDVAAEDVADDDTD